MDSIDGWSNPPPPLENMDSHYLIPQVEDQAANGIILQSIPQDSVTITIGKLLSLKKKNFLNKLRSTI